MISVSKKIALLLFPAVLGLSLSAKAATGETDARLHADGKGWRLEKAEIVDTTRPRVLLIGDSILNGYLKATTAALKGRAYVDAWVNPYHQASGGLDRMITEVLAQGPYDVVHFNLGLHGWQPGRIPEGQFEPLTRRLVEHLRTEAPRARLIWASSTPVTVKGNGLALDPVINPTIIEHNRMAAKVMAELNVSVNDFYSPLVGKLEWARGDQFHWKTPAYEVLATALTQVIASALPKPVSLARPTPEQAAWHAMEMAMFIHFGPATWENVQHSDLSAPLSALNPTELDTDQWVDVAVSMGAKLIVFVAKHDGGFCWWQTASTDYSVKNTPWRDGKGDVMKDLAASCRKRGVALGVYLSPRDKKHNIGVGGRAVNPADQERYNQLYRQQLTELLANYGEMAEVWFDGSNIVPVGDILARHAPRAMIFQGPQATIRWVGNEDGIARYPAWNSVSLTKARTGEATAYDSTPDGEVWQPLECDARIRADWFWSTTNASTLKSVDELMAMYYRSVGHGAVLLLNHTPDTTGKIPAADAQRAAEFGREINRRFRQSLGETGGMGTVIELAFNAPTRIDHVITSEDILQGERVREYVIEGLSGSTWRPLAQGTAIGQKKIDHFTPVEVSKVRLRTTRSAGEPQIRRIAAYSVWGTNPPPPGSVELPEVTRTLWSWSNTNLSTSPTTVDIDLTTHCREAGVYVVEFARTAGSELEVQSVTLSLQGQKIEKGVVQRKVRGAPQYHFTVTEEGVSNHLQIVARSLDGTSRGQATIYRRR